MGTGVELAGRAARAAWPGAVRHERDLAVPMADGTVLLADRWAPAGLVSGPVVLVRTPYGRRGPWGLLYGRLLAAAGWSVVVASVRGTSAAGDRFADPMVHEAADGAATVAWLRRQRWWDGRLGTVGLSYLGYTQWALATDPPPELSAMVVQVGPHEMAAVNWPGGAFALADSLGWAQLVGGPWRQPGAAAIRGSIGRRRALAAALAPTPAGARLLDAAVTATGAAVPWWEGWVGHPPGDPWWSAYDQAAALDRVEIPVLVQGGWHDLFRRAALHQHGVLVRRGVPVGLTMGPWTHTGLVRGWPDLIAEATDWLGAAFAGRVPERAGRVRSAVLGTRSWREWPSWPPPGTRPGRWTLGPGGALADGGGVRPDVGVRPDGGGVRPDGGGVRPDRVEAPGPALASVRFDPLDPTPTLGGALLGRGAGARDQRPVEARGDVAVWTGNPLREPLEVAGTVTATVVVRADGPHHVVVRLCDVAPSGRSLNVCDGIASAPTGRCEVEVDLGPVAARWAVGHRLRVQVAGGSHPRFAPHPGVEGPIATATGRRAVTIEILGGHVAAPVVPGAR